MRKALSDSAQLFSSTLSQATDTLRGKPLRWAPTL